MKQTVAEQAKNIIKTMLKRRYPDVYFDIKTATYEGGNHIRIYWHKGPKVNDIWGLLIFFQYGEPDSESNIRLSKNFPQVHRIFTQRNM